MFMPISGYTGANLKDPLTKAVCPWWKDGEPSLIQYLDNLPKIERLVDMPLRLPVNEKVKKNALKYYYCHLLCMHLFHSTRTWARSCRARSRPATSRTAKSC